MGDSVVTDDERKGGGTPLSAFVDAPGVSAEAQSWCLQGYPIIVMPAEGDPEYGANNEHRTAGQSGGPPTAN